MAPPAADNSWVADFDSFESSEAAPPAAEAQVKLDKEQQALEQRVNAKCAELDGKIKSLAGDVGKVQHGQHDGIHVRN